MAPEIIKPSKFELQAYMKRHKCSREQALIALMRPPCPTPTAAETKRSAMADRIVARFLQETRPWTYVNTGRSNPG